MAFHLHIAGCAPRSGTTLLHQMMISSFVFDEISPHERGIEKGKDTAAERVCTKKPTDIRYAGCVLAANPLVYFLYVVRDPRDVISSRLRDHGQGYFTNLRVWRDSERIAGRLRDHQRFIEVRYEDLVHDPDAVQDALHQRLPFLERKGAFSSFHTGWSGDAVAEMAMNGVRPPSPDTVGRWRHHVDRVSRQIAVHGSVTVDLIRRGYEPDANWESELVAEEARPDSVTPDRIPAFKKLSDHLKTVRRCLSYRLKLWRGLLGY